MKSVIFIFLVIISFCSCDGRYKLKSSKAEAIKGFNLKTLNEPILKYIPEYHAEMVSDTIINNRIQIKITSKLNNRDLVTVASQTPQTKAIFAYKNAQIEVLIQQKDRVLFNKIIDSSLFANTESFWNHAVLESVWVNQDLSLNNSIVLDVVYKNPELKTEKLFYLTVDEKGRYKVEVV